MKTYILKIPNGCTSALNVEKIELTEKYVAYEYMKDLLGGVWLERLAFGTEREFSAFFDEEGLHHDHQVPTIEVNRHVLCGPILIVKNVRDEEGEHVQGGLTDDECTFILSKLKCVGGVTSKPSGGFEVIGFDNPDDLFKAMEDKRKFTQKENNDNWSK